MDGVSSERSLKRLHSVALHNQEYQYMIRGISVSVSSRRTLHSTDLQQRGLSGKCCFLLSGSPAIFVDLMAVVKKTLFIPSSNVVTRWRFGVKKQVDEGQTLCNLHLEQIINWL